MPEGILSGKPTRARSSFSDEERRESFLMGMFNEFILDDTFDGPLFPALFSLNMFLGTPQGQSYSQQQLSDMLTAFGCTDITRHSFVGPTQSGILSAKTADRCCFQKSGD